VSSHVVLLFESDHAPKESESSMAGELGRAGYDVIEVHNPNTAAALVFINRRVEAVVIDAAGDRIFPKLGDSLSAIRPGMPLLRAASTERQAPADGQAGRNWSLVISTLDGLLCRRVA
jgi:hypothetical protein